MRQSCSITRSLCFLAATKQIQAPAAEEAQLPALTIRPPRTAEVQIQVEAEEAEAGQIRRVVTVAAESLFLHFWRSLLSNFRNIRLGRQIAWLSLKQLR
jgi:hypothetical protein